MSMTNRQLRTTADKREIKDFPKLPSATSFIRNTLSEIRLGGCKMEVYIWQQK
jgi:hypothetical protein